MCRADVWKLVFSCPSAPSTWDRGAAIRPVCHRTPDPPHGMCVAAQVGPVYIRSFLPLYTQSLPLLLLTFSNLPLLHTTATQASVIWQIVLGLCPSLCACYIIPSLALSPPQALCMRGGGFGFSRASVERRRGRPPHRQGVGHKRPHNTTDGLPPCLQRPAHKRTLARLLPSLLPDDRRQGLGERGAYTP